MEDFWVWIRLTRPHHHHCAASHRLQFSVVAVGVGEAVAAVGQPAAVGLVDDAPLRSYHPVIR